VINGREIMTLRELLKSSSDLVPKGTVVRESAALGRSVTVGGPVAGEAGWLIYAPGEAPLPGEIALGEELATSSDPAALITLVRGDGPKDFRMVLGCAGWATGQLEAEIGVGAWLPASLDRELVFSASLAEIWTEAYRRTIGSNPAAFTSRGAKA
jgi:putative transcriptional regulator